MRPLKTGLWWRTLYWAELFWCVTYLGNRLVAFLPPGTWLSYNSYFLIGIGIFLARKQIVHPGLPLVLSIIVMSSVVPLGMMVFAALTALFLPGELKWMHRWPGKIFE